MTSSNFKMEVLSGPERRRRWSTAEKLAIIHETYEAEATVSIVARRHGIQPNQLFAWRKLASQGALTATAAEEEVVPASEYRALQAQVKELQRLLGKKTMESEILKEALEIAGGPKKRMLRSISSEGDFGMKAVCETLGVARSNIAARATGSFPEPEDAHHSRIGNWWRISRLSSPTCPPTAIGVSMPSCAATPGKTGVRGSTPSAFTGS